MSYFTTQESEEASGAFPMCSSVRRKTKLSTLRRGGSEAPLEHISKPGAQGQRRRQDLFTPCCLGKHNGLQN